MSPRDHQKVYKAWQNLVDILDKNTKACIDRFVRPPPLYTREGRSATAGLSLPARLFVEFQKLWPKKKLQIRFLDGDPSVHEKVIYHAKDWAKYANLNLDFVSGGDADIRIALMEGEGSWSYIGTDSISIEDQNKPTMNYGWLDPTTADAEYSRVVKHEFGHAIGCPHEHQHPRNGIDWNVENVVADLSGPPNFWDRETIERNLFQRYDENITRYSEFDPDSIMLYPIPARWTRSGVAIGGENHDLSETDKEFIKKMYP